MMTDIKMALSNLAMANTLIGAECYCYGRREKYRKSELPTPQKITNHKAWKKKRNAKSARKKNRR